MDVALKSERERFVAEQLRSGRFASPAEVLEAALARLMLGRVTDAFELGDAGTKALSGHNGIGTALRLARK